MTPSWRSASRRGASRRGRVEEFDEAVGLGRVRADDDCLYPFHCTQIGDGSRTIDAGAAVEFDVVPGHLGQWEAAAIRPACS